MRLIANKFINYIAVQTGVSADLIAPRVIVKKNTIYLYTADLVVSDRRSYSFKMHGVFFHRLTVKRLPIIRSVQRHKILAAFNRAIKIFLEDYDIVRL